MSDMIVAMESDLEEEPNVQNEGIEDPTSNMELLDEEEDDDDVIDIDNPEDLARRGLKRIQIEGENEEYLLDGEGNIYNLQGEFVGTTDGDVEAAEGLEN
jgi:hypothetical protein